MRKEKDTEFKEALSKLRLDLRSTRAMLAAFSIIAGIVKFFLKVPIPSSVLLIIFVWFLLYFVYESWVEKTKNAKGLYNVYFRYNIGDLLFLTVLIHYLGGVEWIGLIFYTLTLVTAGLMLSKKRAIILGLIASLFYFILALLEYFGTLSHNPIFFLEPGLYRSPSYIGTQILIASAIFYFIGETTGTFSKREEIIEERTKELQEKIKTLEKFQRVTVGRELKMIELKKALRQARDEIKKLKREIRGKR